MPAPSTGLVADWDPAAITGLNDGDAAGTVEETIGNNDATSTGSVRPLYKTAGPNGKPYLQYDGADDFSKSAAMTAVAQPYTFFIVFRPNRWGFGNRLLDGQSVNQSIVNQYPPDLENVPSVYTGIQKYSMYAGSNFLPSGTGGGLSSQGGQFGLITAKFNGASSSIALNQNTPATTGNTGGQSFTGICIGAAGDGSLSAKIDFARLLVYDSTIVSAAAVEAYLMSEYALSIPNFLMCDGDSLTFGTGSTGGNTYPAQVLALLGSAWSMIETGVPSQTVVQMESDASTQVDGQLNGLTARKVLCAWGGTNDMATGGSNGTQAYNDYVTYCTNRRAAGWKVIAMTVLPRSATGISANFPTDRATFNSNVVANWATFADALANVAGDNRIGDTGDNTDTTYYDADAIHLNNTGYGVVAGIVETAVDSLTVAATILPGDGFMVYVQFAGMN